MCRTIYKASTNLKSTHNLSICVTLQSIVIGIVANNIANGYVLYSGAAPSYLHHLDTLQTRVEHMSDFKFSSLCNRRNAGLVCQLLAGKGRGNLLTFCHQYHKEIIETL